MNQYNPHIHNRRSIRLKGYDYSKTGLYFITICCERRGNALRLPFGNIKNGEMVLNEYGTIAYNEWMKLQERFTNFELDVFQIMPNHIHGIILLNDVGASLADALNTPALNTTAQNTPAPNENGTKTVNENVTTTINENVTTTVNENGITTVNENVTTTVNENGTTTLNANVTTTLNENVTTTINENVTTTVNENVTTTVNENVTTTVNEKGTTTVNEKGTKTVNENGTKTVNEKGQPQGLPLQRITVDDNWATARVAPTVGDIVGAYKSLVANGCLEIYKSKNETMGKLWQRNYWEHIIRNEQSYQTISNYIINNPAKWNDDKFNPSNNSQK